MSMTNPELLKYLGNFLGEELNRGQRHGEPSKNQYWDAYLISRSLELVNQMQGGEGIQRKLCPECGEDALKRCFAFWDSDSQKWEGNDGPSAGYWCPACGDIERVDGEQDENTVRIHGYDIPVEKRKQRLLDALEAAGYLNEG